MQPQSNNTALQAQQAQDRQASNARTAPTLLPPVDIFEDAAGITLLADLPGVAREDLSIGVDGRNLTIEAPLKLGEANALTSVYAEVRANHFRRSFELSSDLDTVEDRRGPARRRADAAHPEARAGQAAPHRRPRRVMGARGDGGAAASPFALAGSGHRRRVEEDQRVVQRRAARRTCAGRSRPRAAGETAPSRSPRSSPCRRRWCRR